MRHLFLEDEQGKILINVMMKQEGGIVLFDVIATRFGGRGGMGVL